MLARRRPSPRTAQLARWFALVGCALGVRFALAQPQATPGTIPGATPEAAPGAVPADDTDWVEVEDGHTGEVVRIPRAELGPPPTRTADDDATLRREAGMPPRNEPPARWADGPTRCSHYGRRRYCDGPLRVPEPVGPEAELARRLGLGTRTAGATALAREPRATWMQEVHDLAFPEGILWPVDGGSFVRGLKPDRRVRVVVRRRGRRVTRWVVRPGHNGVDIAAREGTHALAIADGLVVYANNEMRGYGNVVLVLHGNGTVSLYSHLRAAWVFPGQALVRGQVVGEVGETGLATGPHLHFEWRRNGVPLDPTSRLTDRPRRPGEPEPPPLPLPEEPEGDEPIELEDEDDLHPENL